MMQLEIKNEGLFEFNYSVFDFLNEEFRKQLQEQQEAERQERMQAVLGQAAAITGAATGPGGK